MKALKTGLLFVLKTLLPLGLGVYLLYFFFASMSQDSIEQFKRAFREANYVYLFLSLLLGFIALVSRAIRWGYVLKPLGAETPFWNRYHAIMIGYLMNLTIPRAGEATRAIMLYRSDKVPFAKSFGTIVAERAVDLVMLSTIGFLTMYFGATDFDNIWSDMLEKFGAKTGEESSMWKWILLGFFGVGLLVVILVVRKSAILKEKLFGFFKGILHGLLSIFQSDRGAMYILHTFLIWICYLGMFAVCFYALDETSGFPWRGILIGFVAGSLGITFTNGGIGTYPLLVGLVIAYYLQPTLGKSAEGIGNALGMLIWSSQTLMMILLGVLSLLLIPKNYKGSEDDILVENIEED